jgi:hypothetical protein
VIESDARPDDRAPGRVPRPFSTPTRAATFGCPGHPGVGGHRGHRAGVLAETAEAAWKRRSRCCGRQRPRSMSFARTAIVVEPCSACSPQRTPPRREDPLASVYVEWIYPTGSRIGYPMPRGSDPPPGLRRHLRDEVRAHESRRTPANTRFGRRGALGRLHRTRPGQHDLGDRRGRCRRPEACGVGMRRGTRRLPGVQAPTCADSPAPPTGTGPPATNIPSELFTPSPWFRHLVKASVADSGRSAVTGVQRMTVAAAAGVLGLTPAVLLVRCKKLGIAAAAGSSVLSSGELRRLGLYNETSGALGTSSTRSIPANSREHPQRGASKDLWTQLTRSCNEGLPIGGTVVQVVKGGLSVHVGVRAFLPASLVARRRVPDLIPFVGTQIKAVVVQVDPARALVVLSRRLYLERSQDQFARELNASTAIGDVRSARVVAVQSRSIVVELSGLEVVVAGENLVGPASSHAVGDQVEVTVCDFAHDGGLPVLTTRVAPPAGTQDAVQRFLKIDHRPFEQTPDLLAGVPRFSIAKPQAGWLDQELERARRAGIQEFDIEFLEDVMNQKRQMRSAISSGRYAGLDKSRCRQTESGFKIFIT